MLKILFICLLMFVGGCSSDVEVEQFSSSYNASTDESFNFSKDFNNSFATMSSHGVYFINENQDLYFMNPSTDVPVKIRSLGICGDQDWNVANACSEETAQYFLGGLKSYKDRLYYVAYELSPKGRAMVIKSTDLTGDNEKTEFQFLNEISHFAVHRGHFYFSDQKQNGTVMQLAMGSKVPKVFIDLNGKIGDRLMFNTNNLLLNISNDLTTKHLQWLTIDNSGAIIHEDEGYGMGVVGERFSIKSLNISEDIDNPKIEVLIDDQEKTVISSDNRFSLYLIDEDKFIESSTMKEEVTLYNRKGDVLQSVSISNPIDNFNISSFDLVGFVNNKVYMNAFDYENNLQKMVIIDFSIENTVPKFAVIK